ncbi:MAG: hypothetical protein KBA15_11255 [Spirochaetes bacterium]|jgi:outer membrane protein assembly factor BamB|nr:hypothetical protein [Spirochaetota bacterium]
MEYTGTLQSYELESGILSFDFSKGILVCREPDEGRRKRWVKKLDGVARVGNITEDGERFYVACENGDANGQFLAVEKHTGETEWFIPGRSFLQLVYGEGLYLIFVDGSMRHYLLRVDTADGSTLWHHGVDEDLVEYSFRARTITLRYASGKSEFLDTESGLRAR